MCVCAQSCLPFCDPMDWTVAYQVPLSMEFSRQEYQNGFPFSNPADLPDPEVESTSPLSPGLVGGFIYHCDTWEAQSVVTAPEKKNTDAFE